MKKIPGFTLLEVLVALAVAAMVIAISSNLLTSLINMRASASEQNISLKYEVLLRVLRGDLENATMNASGKKNIVFNLQTANQIKIELTKPIINPKSRMLEIANVHWNFTANEVSRELDRDPNPLKLINANMEHSLEPISENVYYLSSRIGTKFKKLVLNARSK
jgi:prepilin-type N-terminal cleavage/methylation domain-containing protein